MLLTLAAAVLATHLWLLAGPQALAPVREPGANAPKAESRPLQTRLVVPAPAAAPAGAPGPAQPPSPGGAARTSARLLPASTSVAPAPTPEPGPAPAQASEAAPEPPPDHGTNAAQSGQAAAAPTSPAPAPASPGPEPALSEASAGLPAKLRPSVETAPEPPAAATAAQASPTVGTDPGSSAQHLGAAALQVDRARLPTPVLLNYDMRGQDRGLNYHASGELRWQHNEQHYILSLSVRALLVGSREWRSQGLVGPQGLQPLRFSDKRRTERATHFDHAEGRLVFSANAPSVPLTRGAQDQISLYVQLAAAMASATPPMTPGTRVQVQTATTRDALPWLLTLERQETLSFEGRPLETAYWVCLPRQRFDARIELWTSAEHQHLPARIRITQANGSFIDLQLRGQQALQPLPAAPDHGAKTTSP